MNNFDKVMQKKLIDKEWNNADLASRINMSASTFSYHRKHGFSVPQAVKIYKVLRYTDEEIVASVRA